MRQLFEKSWAKTFLTLWSAVPASAASVVENGSGVAR
jgi:hypothetical protein